MRIWREIYVAVGNQKNVDNSHCLISPISSDCNTVVLTIILSLPFLLVDCEKVGRTVAGDDKLDSRHLFERFLDVAKALELRLHLEHSVVAALVEEWRMGEVLQDCSEVSRPSFGKR